MFVRTRLVVAPEPEPLAIVHHRTVFTLIRDGSLVDQIDEALSTTDVPSVGPLDEALKRQTLVDDSASDEPIVATPSTTVIAPVPTGRAAHLSRCLSDIRDWLGITLETTCFAAGISRGTVYAWRERDSEPRPGTVGSVLRLHALVNSAVISAGKVGAAEWFHAGEPSPIERIASARGDQAVLSAISRQLRRELTGPVPPPPDLLLTATVDDAPARPLA